MDSNLLNLLMEKAIEAGLSTLAILAVGFIVVRGINALAPLLGQVQRMYEVGTTSLDAQNKALELSTQRLTRLLDLEEERNTTLRDEVLALSRKLTEREVNDMDRERRLVENEELIASLRIRVDRLEKEKLADQETINRLKAQVEELTSQNEALKKELDEVVADRARVQKVSDERVMEINQLQAQIKELGERVSEQEHRIPPEPPKPSDDTKAAAA